MRWSSAAARRCGARRCGGRGGSMRGAFPTPTGRGAAEILADRFPDAEGRVRASFDIVWLSGWAPHASQPQPLKPGSAKARLAAALGAREISLGEKAGRE